MKSHFVELGSLLLQLLVLVPHGLTLLLKLVPQQILKILPQINHLTRPELLVIFLFPSTRCIVLIWRLVALILHASLNLEPFCRLKIFVRGFLSGTTIDILSDGSRSLATERNILLHFSGFSCADVTVE